MISEQIRLLVACLVGWAVALSACLLLSRIARQRERMFFEEDETELERMTDEITEETAEETKDWAP